jgi:RNA recognition motif-containing protein
LKDDEDDERDDFEGFGSITELVKNKDKLVQKTL